MAHKLLGPGDKFERLEHELIVGIDFGTTFSGVSYAFLHPGEVPEIQSVTKFSDQAQSSGKVPSVMYYDKNGDLKGAGAKTTQESFLEEAAENEWTRVEYFKMHLRPAGTEIDTNGLRVADLPPNKTAEQVLGDFLGYLWSETETYIGARHENGKALMDKVRNRTQFVLGHPNGWVGIPQQRMRHSARLGGLISNDEDEQDKIKFVTEGEASTLTCLASKFAPHPIAAGYQFILLDAGGGTLDISSYEVKSPKPLRLIEKTTPDCRFAGSVFVNRNAADYLRGTLCGSEFGDEESISDLVSRQFEERLKPLFSDATAPYRLRMNTSKSIPKYKIRSGFLPISGPAVAKFFEFSITQAIDSIIAARNKIMEKEKKGSRVMPVWVVGGFGSSPWLMKRLKEVLGDDDFSFCQPETNLSKAVADGAVRSFLYGNVTARMSRTCYGTDCLTLFDPFDADHIKRRDLVTPSPFGGHKIGPIFSCIAKKDESIEVSEAYCKSYLRRVLNKDDARHTSSSIYCYDGDDPVPLWFEENKGKFRELCKLEADLSGRCTDKTRRNLGGLVDYWLLDFEIELKLGTTELEARIKWEQNGQTLYGPVRVVYA
ncbi:hypothetical protein SCHPADRAFT_940958 [Schizopora paradoxa]|uniref:Actin-like ATPase domain-containing protein n=1 Tax=Schizopora paradoxa TaxID=27342 RepID=A0A0H2RLE2_9AGAM|nr:hypothetical protein SCHPADRAFT_940958 [Schizopora paradoxa]